MSNSPKQPGQTTHVAEGQVEPLVLDDVVERITGILQNEPLKAFYEVRARIKEDPSNITDWTKGIYALIKMENLEEAKQWIGEVYKVLMSKTQEFEKRHNVTLPLSSSNIEKRISQIEQYLDALQAKEAEKMTGEFQELKKDLTQALFCVGIFETERGNHGNAIKYFEKISDLNPSDSEIIEQIIYRASSLNTIEAEETLKRSLEKLVKRGELQKSYSMCQQLLERHPQKLWLHELMGRITVSQNRERKSKILPKT